MTIPAKTGSGEKLPLIAGNWKMNCNHFEAIALVQKLAFTLTPKDYAAVEVAVLPPFTDLRSVQTLISGDKLRIRYGAQDISRHEKGAYTGEISGAMLAKLGCSYVLCGHSERRQYHHEDDTLVNAKVKAALSNSITPILCVGENLEVRREQSHVDYVVGQLKGSLARIPAEQVASAVIAYEPVWAIGTGETASPADAQEMAAAIRAWVTESRGAEAGTSVRILYGGSVKSDSIGPIMAQPDVDGALVGGASLDAGQFAQICRYRELTVDKGIKRLGRECTADDHRAIGRLDHHESRDDPACPAAQGQGRRPVRPVRRWRFRHPWLVVGGGAEPRQDHDFLRSPVVRRHYCPRLAAQPLTFSLLACFAAWSARGVVLVVWCDESRDEG
jgi:triosephosphate isomerase